MSKASQMLVNLPVENLPKSKAFFQALGFTINPQFTDDNAACVVLGDNLFAMLLTHAYFQTFTPRALNDAHTSTEVLTALSLASKDDVDQLAATALQIDGAEVRPPQNHGFMFTRAIADLDGHIWELFWMDPAAMAQ